MYKQIFLFSILFFFISISDAQSVRRFNFIYEFGKNSYNSKSKIFVQDMVVDPQISFKLKMTRKEKRAINKKLNEIDFFNYPNVYRYQNADTTDNTRGIATPCFHFSMNVEIKGIKKAVSWSDCQSGSGSKNRMYEKLQELDRLIEKIILENKAFKKAPKPRAGYAYSPDEKLGIC